MVHWAWRNALTAHASSCAARSRPRPPLVITVPYLGLVIFVPHSAGAALLDASACSMVLCHCVVVRWVGLLPSELNGRLSGVLMVWTSGKIRVPGMSRSVAWTALAHGVIARSLRCRMPCVGVGFRPSLAQATHLSLDTNDCGPFVSASIGGFVGGFVPSPLCLVLVPWPVRYMPLADLCHGLYAPL